MDLKHKLKDLVMSEFAYDLSKYEDEGEAKVNNVTENLVKLFSLYIVSQQRKPLLAYHKYLDSFNDPTIYNATESMIDDYLANNCV